MHLTASTPISIINYSGYSNASPRSPWRANSGNLVARKNFRKYSRVFFTHSRESMLPTWLFLPVTSISACIDAILPQLGLSAKYADLSDNHFRVSEESLGMKEAPIAVDDEPDIDDIVGEPMELQVMRWTPTNEMGVVALFIEFRKELGFPLIEVIRTKFPDAAVFETSSKDYIRRYIEFDFRSSGYKAHLKSKRKCHYVVCWENDWKDCPIPVIELKQEIPAILREPECLR